MPREIEHLKGLDLIVEERLRQVEELGYDVAHDSQCHTPEELLQVGSCYIEYASNDLNCIGQDPIPAFWPEDTEIPWKPEVSAMETAVKGAAFVAAALDLLYAQITGERD